MCFTDTFQRIILVKVWQMWQAHIRSARICNSVWQMFVEAENVFMQQLSFWKVCYTFSLRLSVGRYSSVVIATCYGLDGPGIESLWGEIFRTSSDRPWGLPSLLYNGYRVFTGGKAAGTWYWLPTPSKHRGHERVGLYLYSPSGPSWPVIGCTFTFTLLLFAFDIRKQK